MEEEFKVTRAREVLLYRDSSDPKVATAGIEMRTGWKWKAEEAVRQAESRVHHKRLVGVVTRGRAGLGSFSAPHIDTIKGKDKRCLVQEEVRAVVEEEITCGTVGMRQQAACTRWENAIERKVTWAELWKAEPQQIKFFHPSGI